MAFNKPMMPHAIKYFNCSSPYCEYIRLGAYIPEGKVFELRGCNSRFVRDTAIGEIVVFWVSTSPTTRLCYRVRIMHRVWFRNIFDAFDYCGVVRLLPDVMVTSDWRDGLEWAAEYATHRLRALLKYSRFGTGIHTGLVSGRTGTGVCLDGTIVATRVEVIGDEWLEPLP